MPFFFLAFLSLLAIATPARASDPAANCAAAKQRAAAKKADAKLKCVGKATATGTAVDPLCLSKAEAKFESAFVKADARGGCLTINDAASVEATVDACLSAFRTQLAVASGTPRSSCATAKLKATGKHVTGALSCHARATQKLTPVSTSCLDGVALKFSTSFAKAEIRPDCLTTGDTAAVSAAVDACVDDVLRALPGPTTTTTTTTSTSTTTTTPNPNCDNETAAFSGITAQHNHTRATANPTPTPALSPLCWKTAVANHAQAWANGCAYGHDPALSSYGEGQNIYAAAVSNGFPTTAALDAEPSWASESSNYNYAANSCRGVCGHYTQIVWRWTNFFGCGVKNCTTNSPFGSRFPNWTLVVCNYQPPGNFGGQLPY